MRNKTMNLQEKFEQEQIEKLIEGKDIPEFQAGDTVRVNVRIIEGDKERTQAFEGICIAKKNRGINSSFTLRKISHGVGVERVFPLYSPKLESILVVRKGDVRRAKLYYMRDLSGKAARIKEKRDFLAAKEATEVPVANEAEKEKVDVAEKKPAKKPAAKKSTKEKSSKSE